MFRQVDINSRAIHNVKKVAKIIIPDIKDKPRLIRTSLDKFKLIWTSLDQFAQILRLQYLDSDKSGIQARQGSLLLTLLFKTL